MALYRLLVESWSREQIAFCRELLGFQLSAPSIASLEERGPRSIADHLDWLRADGGAVPDDPVRAEIVEWVGRDPRGVMPHFAADLLPVSPDELRLAQRVAERSQRELIRLYHRFGPERVVHTQAFGGLPLHDLLTKVAELDSWYLACLTGVPGIPLPADPTEAIVAADQHFRWHATRRYDDVRNLVAVAGDEAWTFAKVIRRRTGHFREHFPEMAALP